MNNENLKKTALHSKHVKLKAKLVPFSGWEMPLQYDKIITEHNTVREAAGLFDVSHMGEISVSGNDSILFLQSLVPQDIAKMDIGKAVYTQLCNPNGGIIDDLIVYRLQDIDSFPRFLLIVNASNTEKDYDWITSHTDKHKSLTIENISYHNSLLALQGPNASKILAKIGIEKQAQPKKFHVTEIRIQGTPVTLARTGYTGEDGFEILVEDAYIEDLWELLLKEGESFGLKPIGLAARDTLRLEAALHLHGHDIDETTTPIEAGLGWSVVMDKPDYIGKPILQKQKMETPSKIFVGFKMLNRSIPRKECEIFQEGKKIGITTSGSYSPTLGYPIGLGYIDNTADYTIGAPLEISIRNKFHPAEIVNKPFYRREKSKDHG